jgi:hypothetical protein
LRRRGDQKKKRTFITDHNVANNAFPKQIAQRKIIRRSIPHTIEGWETAEPSPDAKRRKASEIENDSTLLFVVYSWDFLEVSRCTESIYFMAGLSDGII